MRLMLAGTQESKTKSIEIAPYIRYSFLRWKKLSVMGMASICAYRGKSESISIYDYEHDYGGHIHQESSSEMNSTQWRLRIRPVLLYSLSDNFKLLVHSNFFRLDCFRQTDRWGVNVDDSDGIDYGYTRINAGLDVRIDTYNILPSFGCLYIF